MTGHALAAALRCRRAAPTLEARLRADRQVADALGCILRADGPAAARAALAEAEAYAGIVAAARAPEPPVDHDALRADLNAYWRESFPESFPAPADGPAREREPVGA